MKNKESKSKNSNRVLLSELKQGNKLNLYLRGGDWWRVL